MNQSSHGRVPETYERAGHEGDDNVPPQRELRRRGAYGEPDGNTRSWAGNHEGALLGALALALGAGALVAWYRPSGGRSEDRGRGSAQRERLPVDETDELIASNKVEGTAVYDRNGEKIGSVYNFMVGKRSGQVAYAVVSFGGFLGLGGGYHPLPWSALTYDSDQGGYVVEVDKDRLRNAPSQADEGAFSDPSYGRRVTEYWLIL